MTFLFDTSVPDEVEGAVSPILREIRDLFPLWIQAVYIGWDGNNADDLANIRVEEDYRFARLTICPHFLNIKEAKLRKEALTHEIIHCFTSPIADAAKEELEEILDDPKAVDAAMRRISKVTERVTQDFAYSLARML